MLQIKTYLMFENVVKYAIEGMKFILLFFSGIVKLVVLLFHSLGKVNLILFS
jgi:hypothetical protein